MNDGSDSRGVAAALIVMARYLSRSSPDFSDYLAASIDHAFAGGVAPDDLALLRMMQKAIGGAMPSEP